jgi:hypothetical protein
MDFSSSQVGTNLLPSLYYFPNYITEAEEQRILGEVHATQAKWVQVRPMLAQRSAAAWILDVDAMLQSAAGQRGPY